MSNYRTKTQNLTEIKVRKQTNILEQKQDLFKK